MVRESKTEILVDPGAYIAFAAMLLLIPAPCVISWVCAIVLHEFFHCISLLFFGYQIFEIKFGCTGAEIISAPLTAFHGIVCTAAGPVGSLLVLLFSSVFPVFSLCVLIQSIFNLLPVYPLDGGKLIRFLLSYLKNTAVEEMLANVITWFFLAAITLASIALSLIFQFGITPLCIPVFLLIKSQIIKIPCKQTLHRVQ